MFLKKNNEGSIIQLSKCIEECDAIIIGAGSGLSTAAGLTYAGERLIERVHYLGSNDLR